jgi:hypothetical protein
MKKTVFILLAGMLAITDTSVFSQNVESFVQFESGIDMGYMRGRILKGEYGKTWKWLDASLAMSYEWPGGDNSYHFDDKFEVNNTASTSMPIKSYSSFAGTAFSLNARIDIIRFFTANSRHAFKIGCSLAYAFSQEIHHSYGGRTYKMSIDNEEQFTLTQQICYEFEITPKYAVGAFLSKETLLYKTVGLSIRRNF